MTRILLSCDSPSYENALEVKRGIEKYSNFSVALDIEDWETYNKSSTDPNDLDSKLAGADLLLVFQFKNSNMSVWVMLDGDADQTDHDDDFKESFFPECVDFSESFDEGIDEFMFILESDFGLSLRPLPEPKAIIAHQQNDKSGEPTLSLSNLGSSQRIRIVRRINGLINRFKKRISV